MLVIFFVVYAAEIGAHALQTLPSGSGPRDLIVDLFFPVHSLLALTGLSAGLHLLRVLKQANVIVAVLLEVVGVYISSLCLVLATVTPPSRARVTLLCVSALLACFTLQAIGLSCGLSFFHEFGVLSARSIAALKHILFAMIVRLKRLLRFFYHCVVEVSTALATAATVLVTRIRSGDRVSRFIKTYFLRPLLPARRCLHLLFSFAVHYTARGLRRAAAQGRILIVLLLQRGYEEAMVLMEEVVKPFARFAWDEIRLIISEFMALCRAVVGICEELWAAVLSGAVKPMGRFIWHIFVQLWQVARESGYRSVRMLLKAGKSVLLQLVVYPARSLLRNFHTLLRTLAVSLRWSLSIIVHEVAAPLTRTLRAAVARGKRELALLGTHCRSFGRLVLRQVLLPLCSFLCRSLLKIKDEMVAHIFIPLRGVSLQIFVFLWNYLFAIILTCFGIFFFINAARSLVLSGSFSLMDTCGLFLGGYVCVLSGSLLLTAKCPPFHKQQELMCFLTSCYQRLDFFLVYLLQYAHSALQPAYATAFRSATKLLSVLWKGGFDALDFILTLLVQGTKSQVARLYNCIFRPAWRMCTGGVLLVWKSPFASFGASLAALAVAFFCHARGVSLSPQVNIAVVGKGGFQLISALGVDSIFKPHVEWEQWAASVWAVCYGALSMGRRLWGVPVEDLWLSTVDQSLWKLSESPSLGGSLYFVHLCGSLLVAGIDADPKVFIRGSMKIIYYPLILSYLLSYLPLVPMSLQFTGSFGKLYALYTLVSITVLMAEMNRLRTAPDVRQWHSSRGTRSPVRRRHRAVSCASVRAGLREEPFGYLKQPSAVAPAVIFECSECPICMENLLPLDPPAPRSLSTAVETHAHVHVHTSPSVCLPCGHLFHEECALDWLREQAHCPCCREVVPPSSGFCTPRTLMEGVFL